MKKTFNFIAILLGVICFTPFGYADIDNIRGQQISNLSEVDSQNINDISEFEGQTIASAGFVSDCTCTGGETFCWEMEASGDVTAPNNGCSVGDTSGTETGSTTWGTSQIPPDGSTYYLYTSSNSRYWEWTVSNNNLININDFRITWDMNIGRWPATGSSTIMEARFDGSNRIYCSLLSSNDLRCFHVGAGSTNNITISLGPGIDTWRSCRYEGKQGVAGNDHYLGCDAITREENDNLVSAPNSATVLRFGGVSGNDTANLRFDNVHIGVSNY